MNISKLSIRYGAAVAVVVGLILLFGVLSLTRLPLQLMPNVSFPQIAIYNNWRAAAPEEVEEAIVQPQEEILRNNAGLESIISSTSRGSGQVRLNYQLGTDMQEAMLEVISRLNQAPSIPRDALEPVVSGGGGNNLPGAATVLIYAKPNNPVKDMVHYQDLIEERVEPRLARIPGVANVDIQSSRQREVNITINPYKTAALGIQVSDIAQALSRARDVSGGFADVGRRRYTVRFLGQQQVEGLGDLVMSWQNNQPIYLREIAEISVDYAEKSRITLRSGVPSYYLAITRKNDANTVQVLDQINLAIAELNAGVLADADLKIELSFDASLHIRRAIAMVQGNLLLGIFLASIVLWYLIRNVRATLVITLTVPLSLMVAFIALSLLDLTLNVISLAGLAFAVGLVMDAAIIVLENVYRLRQSGMKMVTAIIEGCSQVSGALFSSTLTTVAIFVPILFMAGVEGQLFKDLAITLSIAVLASMLSALTVLPAISSRWVTIPSEADRYRSVWEKLSRLILILTDGRRAQSAWIVGILGTAMLSMWLLFPKIDFLPKADIDAISVFFNTPDGINVRTIEEELAADVVGRLEPYLRGEKEPGIRAYNFATFGGFSTQVYIYPSDSERVDELIALLRSEILAGLPDTRSYVSKGSMLNMSSGGRSIDVDLQGEDLDALMAAASVGQELISGFWENTNVTRGGLSMSEPELQISPRDRRISTAGLDRATVGSVVRAYTGGLFVGEYFDGNKRLDMILRTASWQSPEELRSLPVATPFAGVQTIGDLVDIERTVGPTQLQRVDGQRTVTLSVLPPEHVTLEEAIEKLQTEATPALKAVLPPDATVKYRGNADRLAQALSEVSRNFLLALVILFMIMAALFKSIRDSLLVLLVMPIALAGGLTSLALLNLISYQSLDLLTMIGFIILLGLVVNNAILLVDQTRRAEREGMNRRDAVEQAIRFRARPIFMSSLTSIFGMMPLMLIPGVGSEIYRGLATVIVGGMSACAIFTLLLLPSLLRLQWQSRRVDSVQFDLQGSTGG
jgi:multidrug efflux pump subunit AcrB|tara:strand:+ start:1406 stop:4492 length:3087 start_codon:yes stop_codon:yes gene_type:complete